MVYIRDETDRMIRLVAKAYGRELLKFPNVVGFSNVPQPRIRKGRIVPHEKVLRVYVTKKLPESMLKENEIIPKKFYGVPTDVVEIGRIKALAAFAERYRPVPCGVSTSRADQVAAGTIGWWIVTQSMNYYLISNNHVWAKENNGSQGDPLLQPGRLDGGDPSSDVFATLADFVPLKFDGSPNYVDLAVAKCVDMRQCYAAIMKLGGVANARDPTQGETVRKVGRTTGLTIGEVIDVSATLQVEYSSGTALFEDVAIVQGSDVIVQGGDSGSPVIADDQSFVGLLFAGSDDGKTMVFCKTSRIVEALSDLFNQPVHILTINSPPPFEKTIEYRYVYIVPSPQQIVETTYAIILSLMLIGTVIAIIRAAAR